MKKVLFIVGRVESCGGTERMANIIANGLEGKGHQITVSPISGTANPYFRYNSAIEISPIYSKGKGMWPLIKATRAFVKQGKFDVVIDVESGLSLITVPALLGVTVKHICWEHFNFNNNVGTMTRDVARQMAALFCDKVVVLTDADKKLWQRKSLVRNKVKRIHNPSPSKTFKKKINNKQALAVGRLSHQKGFDLLIKAWEEVAKERPDWSLNIIGEGSEKDYLQRLIDESKLNDVVKLKPFTDDIDTEYQQASMLAMSSRFEGFGLVITEAMSNGLPVVSFDCEIGPFEIIIEGTGLLARANDIAHLSKKLLEAIDMFDDAECYANFSKSAYTRSKDFSEAAIIKHWEELINE